MTSSKQMSKAKRLHKHLNRMTKKGAHAVKRSFVTLGDLISAAYEVGGSEEAAEQILSPVSPLGHLLDRRIVFAHY